MLALEGTSNACKELLVYGQLWTKFVVPITTNKTVATQRLKVPP